MFLHHLKIIWRNLLRDRQFSLINLIGLTTGFVGALLIFLWVIDELRIDRFHENDQQLFQVMQEYPTPKGVTVVDWTPALLASTLKEELPEVKHTTVVKSGVFDNGIITYGDKHLRVNAKLSNTDFFDVFSYPLLQGDIEHALSNKLSVLISEKTAIDLFGTIDNVIGETIDWEKKGYYDYIGTFTVEGVFEDAPTHSSEDFDIVFNSDYYLEVGSPSTYSWNNNPVATYVVLRKGADIDVLNAKITSLIQSKNEANENKFFLKKYSENYLYGNYENGKQAGGRIEYVRLFSFIAFLILLIASINFMNLSTARASNRMNEIGVKKTLGASRASLITQFISESLVFSVIALGLALCIIVLLLPQFNQVTGKELSVNLDWKVILIFFGITLLTGLLAGSYPAFYLSGFKPVTILKGKLITSFGEEWTRKGLVVFQFMVSATLIATVIIIYQQMQFVQTKNLGYNRDNVIHITKEGALKEKLEPFLSEIRNLSGVEYASNSSAMLVGNENFSHITDWEGKSSEGTLLANILEANYDFIETFDIELKEGRSFSKEYGAEISKVILNETAVKSMGLKNPIGKTITFWREKMQIIGVADDFQYQSLHNTVEPFLIKLFSEENYGKQIWIKIKAGEEMATIDQIQEKYAAFNPGYPFQFRFVEEDYQALYESETKVAFLSKYFAGIAIIISCFGLFGLSMFTAQKRQKEIGIRKVLGASIPAIVGLLSKDFLKLIIVAFALAIPIAWLLMNRWLNNFAFRIDIEWWVFALVGIAAISIALLTVSFQSIKAALANPIQSLRNE